MLLGMLLSTVGTSMIWPFLVIYVSEKLQQPLTTVTSLLTINSAVSLGAAFIAGPLTDRLGRKGVLVVSLISNGLVYLFLGQAATFAQFAILMAFWGLFTPLYRVGGDAMLADLVPPERRADAFAMLRMSHNLGIAVGPAVGGFIAASSYGVAFVCAACGLAGYGLLLAFFAHETLPESDGVPLSQKPRHALRLEGYDIVLHDRRFMISTAGLTLAQMCIIPIWVLLSVYAKRHFSVPESQFGLIAATNAVMVILFQFAVTQKTKTHPPLLVMAAGAAIYALATFGVSLASGFWGFWLCMVVMSTGELILVPTSSTYAANLAPRDMRGRYMSIYGLSWGIASGIASPMGGFLSDTLGPRAIWYGGALMGALGAAVFLSLEGATRRFSMNDSRRSADERG